MASARSNLRAWCGAPADLLALASTMQEALRPVREELERELHRVAQSDDPMASQERAKAALEDLDTAFEPWLEVRHSKFDHEEEGPLSSTMERVNWDDVVNLELRAAVPSRPYLATDLEVRDRFCSVSMNRNNGVGFVVLSSDDPDWISPTHRSLRAHAQENVPTWAKWYGDWVLTIAIVTLVFAVGAWLVVSGDSRVEALAGLLTMFLIGGVGIGIHVAGRRFTFPKLEVLVRGRRPRSRRLAGMVIRAAGAVAVALIAAGLFALISD